MNTVKLSYATLVGTLLQLAMVIAGHFVPLIRQNFMYGGLGLSLVAGILYGARTRSSWCSAAAGGLIAGGACALIGIALSCILKDVPTAVLLFGTVGSAVAGVLGALLGRLALPVPATLGARSAS